MSALDREIDRLYQAPLDGFVAQRNALAARLRASGKAADSAAVKALSRPSVSAWALNQVYWLARKEYDRLIAAGDRLRSMQQQMLAGRSHDPRDAMQQRQEAIRAVVARAVGFLTEGGGTVTDATRQRLSVTADALATWGSQPQGYTPGRLTRDLDPPGFAALAALGPPPLRLVSANRDGTKATPPPAAKRPPGPAVGRTQRDPGADSGAARRAEQHAAREREAARRQERERLGKALRQAERELQDHLGLLERARERAARLVGERDRLRGELDGLERQLETLRARLRQAEHASAEGEKDVTAAAAAHVGAQRRLEDVRLALGRLEGERPVRG